MPLHLLNMSSSSTTRKSVQKFRLMVSALSIFTFLGLCSCAAQLEVNLASPYFNAFAGSKLFLLQSIEIPAETASVYIQDGKVKTFNDINRYSAYCNFEVNTRMDVRQTVMADEFKVIRHRQDFHQVSNVGATRYVALVQMGDDDGGPIATVYETALYLHSDKQPDVLRMTCSHWDDPHVGNYLTVAEIQQTINGLFRLEIPVSGTQ